MPPDAPSARPRRDFKRIAGAALARVDSVLQRWLPHGKREGAEWVATNPNRTDRRAGSFKVNTTTGAWSDFATGDAGGDLVSLVAYVDRCSNQGEAADALGEFLGLNHATLPKAKPPAKDLGELVSPVPADAPPPLPLHLKHGSPAAVWTYRDAAGAVLAYVCRFNTDHGKEVLPQSLWRKEGGLRWHWKGLPTPRPLYGLDKLAAAPEAAVIVTEGEKAADAAGRALPDLVAVTSPSGAQSPDKADWSPLAGRVVLVWPDADPAGLEYAAEVGRLARAAGAKSVAILDPSELRADPPKGWDAADAEEEAIDPAKVAVWLASAETVQEPDPRAGLPRFDLVEGIKGRRPGVYWCGLTKDPSGAEIPAPPLWICSPLRIDATTRDAAGGEWGRLLAWSDRDRRGHRWAMPMAMLAGSGEELRAALLAGGLEITSHPAERRRLQDYITGARPAVAARCVSRTGWAGSAFVLPGRVYGDSEREPVLFQSAEAEPLKLAEGGTLAGWRDGVALPCVGHLRLVLSLSLAFAGPLAGLIGAEGGGLHLRGESSTGKTSALRVAASVWGGPAFVRSWRATDNGLEGVAAAHSDLLLCLDELGELPPRVAGGVAYMLANGTGKVRARRDGSARPPATWRVLFLSTGEVGLADLVAEGGGRSRAGQEVRVIDLPADAGEGCGLFAKLTNPGRFADSLADAAAAHHGHAGPLFVERLTSDPAKVRAEVREARDTVAARLAPPDAAGQVRRVAGRFALVAVAGELATEWGLTGWPQGEAIRAADDCFRAWLAARGTTGASEPAAMVRQVRRFLEAHGESRFTAWDCDGRATINRAGFRRPVAGEDGEEFFVLPEVFRAEVCAGFDAQAVARVLADAGALMKDTDGKGTTRRERLPVIGNARCYRLLPALWSVGNA